MANAAGGRDPLAGRGQNTAGAAVFTASSWLAGSAPTSQGPFAATVAADGASSYPGVDSAGAPAHGGTFMWQPGTASHGDGLAEARRLRPTGHSVSAPVAARGLPPTRPSPSAGSATAYDLVMASGPTAVGSGVPRITAAFGGFGGSVAFAPLGHAAGDVTRRASPPVHAPQGPGSVDFGGWYTPSATARFGGGGAVAAGDVFTPPFALPTPPHRAPSASLPHVPPGLPTAFPPAVHAGGAPGARVVAAGAYSRFGGTRQDASALRTSSGVGAGSWAAEAGHAVAPPGHDHSAPIAHPGGVFTPSGHSGHLYAAAAVPHPVVGATAAPPYHGQQPAGPAQVMVQGRRRRRRGGQRRGRDKQGGNNQQGEFGRQQGGGGARRGGRGRGRSGTRGGADAPWAAGGGRQKGPAHGGPASGDRNGRGQARERRNTGRNSGKGGRGGGKGGRAHAGHAVRGRDHDGNASIASAPRGHGAREVPPKERVEQIKGKVLVMSRTQVRETVRRSRRHGSSLLTGLTPTLAGGLPLSAARPGPSRLGVVRSHML